METIILSIAIMLAAAAALSAKVLLGREREVKRFGCGSFTAAGPAPAAASASCGVCGAQEGEACRNEDDPAAASAGDRGDFSRN